jgi:hypothetical protein
MRGGDGGGRGAGGGLAELHMDDAAPLRCQFMSTQADLHGAEGFDKGGHARALAQR